MGPLRIAVGLLIWPLGVWWLTEAAAAAHPDKWTRSNRVSMAALAGSLGFLGFIVMVAASAPPKADPAPDLVVVNPPQVTERVSVGDPVEISFTLRNDTEVAPDGIALTMGGTFFSSFVIQDATPAWSQYAQPLGLHEIIWGAPNPGRQVQYRLRFVAAKAGTHPLTLNLRTGKGDLASLKSDVVVLP